MKIKLKIRMIIIYRGELQFIEKLIFNEQIKFTLVQLSLVKIKINAIYKDNRTADHSNQEF